MIVVVEMPDYSRYVTVVPSWSGSTVLDFRGQRFAYAYHAENGLPVFQRERAPSKKAPAGYRESHSATRSVDM